MHDLPTVWSSVCVTVFLLGMRHGLDADHLAAIDGLTRLHQAAGQRLAGCCGALFSLGHGAVVLAIALAVGALSERWAPPPWLHLTGAWISIGCLALLGAANLRAVVVAPRGAVVRLVGVKAPLLSRVLRARGPWAVAGVGALFALSFDTLSQAALFAVTAGRFGGIERALELGALFVLGMLLSDGLNGWVIARLVGRADRIAARASRAVSVIVAAASLLVAALNAARLASPRLDAWLAGRELLIGGGVAVLVIVAAAGIATAGMGARPAKIPLRPG